MLYKKWLGRTVLTLLLVLSVSTRADMIVLVHGYLSNAQTWDINGIMPVLESNGWQRAGYLVGSEILPPAPGRGVVTQGNRVYLASLPSEAPLMIQASVLRQLLNNIPAQNDEKRIVVAHSVGGVVARLLMLQNDAPKVDALITIAAPHLGTHRAEQALDLISMPFPFSMMPDVLGGYGTHVLRRSSGLLFDLVRPRPGSLLFWMNAQQHPEMAYYSIVRGNPVVIHGDWLVPAVSQDMKNIPSLRGKAKTVVVSSSHSLTPQDGVALMGIVQGL